MLDQLTAALLVLALAGTLAWATRRGRGSLQFPRTGRWGRARHTPLLRETCRLALTAHHQLHRIEGTDGEVLLLVTHPGGVSQLVRALGVDSLTQEAAAVGGGIAGTAPASIGAPAGVSAGASAGAGAGALGGAMGGVETPAQAWPPRSGRTPARASPPAERYQAAGGKP